VEEREGVDRGRERVTTTGHTPRLEQTREVEGRVEGVLVRGAEDVAAGGEGLAVELLGLLQLATLLEDEPARSTRGA